MPFVRDSSGALRLDGLGLADVVRDAGTPTYVYDLDAMAAGARALRAAFDGAPHLVAYAVKANSAGGVVRVFAREGCGADVVSGAELLVASACGIDPDAIIFSGVAKTDDEIDRAVGIGARGIAAIQIESFEEIARVEARARASGRRARVGVRVNPSVDLDGVTHANIATGHDKAKFGIARDDVVRALEGVERSAHLELVGLATHVGSQLTSTQPYVESARALFGVARAWRGDGRGRALRYVDTGGGFGIDYRAPFEPPGKGAPAPGDFVRAIRAEMRAYGLDDLAHYVEPGRSLVARHGVLLARVLQSKVARAARWLMIDAGMNDLLRPALYQAIHGVVPLDRDVDEASAVDWRVVGPVCESSDDFGMHRLPADPPAAVAIMDVGAYGYVMASEYNGRTLPAEVFVASSAVVARTARRPIDAWVQSRVAAGA